MIRDWLFSLGTLAVLAIAGPLMASSLVPGDADYAGGKGVTLYVSPAGDNSDGTSWAKAYRTIQAALNAVPDANGGHRVIVRPGHYIEPNLEVPHKGAAGSYNLFIGDIDGKLGSGATGWVVIDAGDPVKGFKAWDWWSNMRASTTAWNTGNNKTNFSCIVWDRWALRNLYATGGDAGLFWDLTHESGKGFTVLVEDCIGIGRAFGGGLCYPIVRPDEPSMFRRCYFMALDWGGDTCAVLLGGSEKTMPEAPHAVFEDCTLVHPDNAVQVSYASQCVRAEFKKCRMVVLNFSQRRFRPPPESFVPRRTRSCCMSIWKTASWPGTTSSEPARARTRFRTPRGARTKPTCNLSRTCPRGLNASGHGRRICFSRSRRRK